MFLEENERMLEIIGGEHGRVNGELKESVDRYLEGHNCKLPIAENHRGQSMPMVYDVQERRLYWVYPYYMFCGTRRHSVWLRAHHSSCVPESVKAGLP